MFIPYSKSNMDVFQISLASVLATLTSVIECILYHLHTLLLFTGDQILDTVIPGTAFGILAALSGPVLDLPVQPASDILKRIPLISLWLWLAILQFCLHNQSSRNSILEDGINKPWRSIPSNRITAIQTQRLWLYASLTTALVSYHVNILPIFGVYLVLETVYNDYGGGDHSGVARNMLCAAGFTCYFSGALSIALGPEVGMSSEAWQWTLALTAGVLATTIQAQDLRDEEGDRIRGRRTLVTEMGRKLNLYTIMILVPCWTIYLSLYRFLTWRIAATLPIMAGMCVVITAFQALNDEGKKLDRRLYKLWCVWMLTFCPLPCLVS